MRKLILEEDEVVEQIPQDLSSSNLITTLIKNAWDSVDLYSSVLVTLQQNGDDNVTFIIDDIISSLYINIGQLESALQEVNDKAQIIDDVKDDSELGEVIIPNEDVQVNAS